MVLKPQDLFVTLKLAVWKANRPPYAQLAVDVAMSVSEVHASVRRAQACGLLHGIALNNRPNMAAIEEFLFHGLRYVFPAERGAMTRGMPTAYAASPLAGLIDPGNEPIPVWPSGEGKQRGLSFEPLYKSAPIAALRDSEFYEYLALVDALRDGRVRERKLAEKQLHVRLGDTYARS